MQIVLITCSLSNPIDKSIISKSLVEIGGVPLFFGPIETTQIYLFADFVLIENHLSSVPFS
tara:strand:+ start:274 stop:456 length:183 start_codon:yes stop_codon:yes gene_type:complete